MTQRRPPHPQDTNPNHMIPTPIDKSKHTSKSNERLWYSSPITSPSIPPRSDSKNHRTSKSNGSLWYSSPRNFAPGIYSHLHPYPDDKSKHTIESNEHLYGILRRLRFQASHLCQVPRITGPANRMRVCGIRRHKNLRQGFIHIYTPDPDAKSKHTSKPNERLLYCKNTIDAHSIYWYAWICHQGRGCRCE